MSQLHLVQELSRIRKHYHEQYEEPISESLIAEFVAWALMLGAIALVIGVACWFKFHA